MAKRATAEQLAARADAQQERRERWRVAIARTREAMLARDTLLHGRLRARQMLAAHVAETKIGPGERKRKQPADNLPAVAADTLALAKFRRGKADDDLVAEAELIALEAEATEGDEPADG